MGLRFHLSGLWVQLPPIPPSGLAIVYVIAVLVTPPFQHKLKQALARAISNYMGSWLYKPTACPRPGGHERQMKVWSHIYHLIGYVYSHQFSMGGLMCLWSLPSALHTLKIINWIFKIWFMLLVVVMDFGVVIMQWWQDYKIFQKQQMMVKRWCRKQRSTAVSGCRITKNWAACGG